MSGKTRNKSQKTQSKQWWRDLANNYRRELKDTIDKYQAERRGVFSDLADAANAVTKVRRNVKVITTVAIVEFVALVAIGVSYVT